MEQNQSGANTPGGTERPPQQEGDEQQQNKGGKNLTPSDAPNASFETGAGEENTGLDAEAIGSITLSNEEFHDLEENRDSRSTTGETGEAREPGDASREAE